jgi:hypothetical protein
MEIPRRFRFREDVLRSAERRIRRRLLATFAATAALVVLVWGTALRAHGARGATLVSSLVLLSFLALLTFRRRMGRLRARWSSFEIVLDEEGIRRVVAGFPDLSIARADARSVGESGAGIVVRDSSGRAILVPRELDGYHEVREALARGGAPGPG